MKIVITGGFGFIGSNILNEALKKKHEVVVVDNLVTAAKQNVSQLVSSNCYNTGKLKFIPLDLSCGDTQDDNWHELTNHLYECDIVYHLASSVGVKYVDKHPKSSILNSFDINNNMFSAFQMTGCRVMFASTSEVYGDANLAKETDTLKIGSPDTLRWGYACGKLMSEFLLRSMEIRATVMRFFNVTGKGQISKHGMVLPTFVERALKNEDLIVHGDGFQTRTFCDVRDAVSMMDSITSDDHIDQIYNIGNPHNLINMTELAKTVIRVTNSNSKIRYVDYDKAFSSNFGEIYSRSPDITKISQHYKPKYTLDDIIESLATPFEYPKRVLDGDLGIIV